MRCHKIDCSFGMKRKRNGGIIYLLIRPYYNTV